MGRIYIEQGIIFWIKTVVKTTRIAILPLQALGEPVNYWDIIIHLMTTKLDTVTKREWEKTQSVITGDIKLSNLTNFLETQCIYLERMMIEKFLPQPSKS